MEVIGHTGRAGRGMVLAWPRWQLGLAGLGIIVGIALTDGPLKPGAGGEGRPSARIAQEGHATPVWTLAFAASTRLAASTISGEVQVTELATGESRRLQGGAGSYDRSLAFSPSGRVLAMGGSGPDVSLWDVEAGIEQEPLRAGKGTVRSVTFAPDGTKLAVGTWKSRSRPARVTIWEWPGRRRLADLGPFPGSINALAISPDGGRMVIADASGWVLLRDVGTGQELARWQAHEAGILGLALSPDGRLIATTCYVGGVVRLWDAIGGGPRGALTVSTGVAALAFSPDGTLLAVARGDGVASLSDVASGRQVGAVRVPSGSLHAVAFSEDGRVLATGGTDGSVRLWDVKAALDGNW
jgi:WD40 repeat protein